MDNKYQILGVSEGDDIATIKKAYREAARKYHPDVNGGAAINEEIFRMITKAYAEIIDEKTGKRVREPGRGSGNREEAEGSTSWNGAESWIHQAAREGVEEGTILFVRVLNFGWMVLRIVIGVISRIRIHRA